MKTVFVVDDDGLLSNLIARMAENQRGDVASLHGLDRLRLGSLAGLSHDLRTPLTAIKIALDGLRAGGAEANAQAASKLVEIGRRNIDRVIHIVENELGLLRAALDDGNEPR